MINPERADQPLEQPYAKDVRFNLPARRDQLNQGWCDLFNTYYGGGRFHTAVRAWKIQVQKVAPHQLEGMKRFSGMDVSADGKPGTLYGRVSRMELIPNFDHFGQHLPQIVLTEVVKGEAAKPIHQTKDQEFYLPLEFESFLHLWKADN